MGLKNDKLIHFKAKLFTVDVSANTQGHCRDLHGQQEQVQTLLRYEAKVTKSVKIGHQVWVKTQAALYFCLFPVSVSKSNFFPETGEGNSWRKGEHWEDKKIKSESQKKCKQFSKMECPGAEVGQFD